MAGERSATAFLSRNNPLSEFCDQTTEITGAHSNSIETPLIIILFQL